METFGLIGMVVGLMGFIFSTTTAGQLNELAKQVEAKLEQGTYRD